MDSGTFETDKETKAQKVYVLAPSQSVSKSRTENQVHVSFKAQILPMGTQAWAVWHRRLLREASAPPAWAPSVHQLLASQTSATSISSEDLVLPSTIPIWTETLSFPRPNVPSQGRHSPRSPEPKVWEQGFPRTQETQAMNCFHTRIWMPCPSWASAAQMSNDIGTENGKQQQKQPQF